MITSKRESLASLESSIDAPVPSDVIYPDDTPEEIVQALEIITQYRGDWQSKHVAEMQSDMIQVTALNALLIQRVGLLIGYADTGDEELKYAQHGVRVAVRKLKSSLESEGRAIKGTQEDVRDLSYVKTQKLFEQHKQNKAKAAYYKSMYYTFRDFAKMLNDTVARLWSTEGAY